MQTEVTGLVPGQHNATRHPSLAKCDFLLSRRVQSSKVLLRRVKAGRGIAPVGAAVGNAERYLHYFEYTTNSAHPLRTFGTLVSVLLPFLYLAILCLYPKENPMIGSSMHLT